MLIIIFVSGPVLSTSPTTHRVFLRTHPLKSSISGAIGPETNEEPPPSESPSVLDVFVTPSAFDAARLPFPTPALLSRPRIVEAPVLRPPCEWEGYSSPPVYFPFVLPRKSLPLKLLMSLSGCSMITRPVRNAQSSGTAIVPSAPFTTWISAHAINWLKPFFRRVFLIVGFTEAYCQGCTRKDFLKVFMCVRALSAGLL